MSLAQEYGMAEPRRRGPKKKTQAVAQSPDAEKSALGCCMLSPDCVDLGREAGLCNEWFYDMRHQVIWTAMGDVLAAGRALDIVTLQQHLRDRGALEQVGGIGYLSQLSDQVPSAANLSYYLDIIREKWMLRVVEKTGQALATDARSIVEGEKTEVATLVARAEKEILKLCEEGQRTNEVLIKEILREVINELQDYHRGHAQIRGITCGLSYMDKLLGGIGAKNGNYCVLSARPGMGKTSLAMQWAEYAALDYVWWDPVLEKDEKTGKLKPIIDVIEENGEKKEKIRCERRVGVPAGVFSQEMAKVALVQRMVFSRGRGDLQRWRTGFAREADLVPLAKATGELAKSKVFVDDTARCTIETLKAKARRMRRQHGVKFFVVDYIQLLRCSEKRFREDRVQELSEISGELQALGKELDVPFLVLAQMNREFEKDPKRKPRLSDLKDCGSIEQDADQVLFLYEPKLSDSKEEQWEVAKEKVYGPRDEVDWSVLPIRVNLFVGKNRYGPAGKDAELLFERSSTRFLDYVEWLKETGQMQLAAGERKPGQMFSEEAYK